jgi:preprotein translocase subunit SecA
MRVFASDTLKSMMGRLGMPEDEAIEHRIISKSLESAQEKIEGFNFDSRKHVLEFDDVINKQRTNIYGMRRKLLLGSIDDVEEELDRLIGVSEESHPQGTLSALASAAAGSQSPSLLPKRPSSQLSSDTPDIQSIIAKKIAEFGREAFLQAVRIILLQVIDMFWVEHLEVMDHTRSSVNLRAYGQRDPLVEYKKEGLRLFKEMQVAMKDQIERILPNIVPVVNGQQVKQGNGSKGYGDIKTELKEIHENAQIIGAGDGSNGSAGSGSVGSGKKGPEVGRNDPCPCGSGKKYKKCHGMVK